MRKRINSLNSPSRGTTNPIQNTHIKPLFVETHAENAHPIVEQYEHASDIDLPLLHHDHIHDAPSSTDLYTRFQQYCYEGKKYQRRQICQIIILACASIFILSSTVGLMLSKTGITYKINGFNTILSPQDLQSPKYKLIAKSVPISKSTSFAVVVNTFKRPDMLKLSLDHWVNQCGTKANISQVFVVWAELDKEPPTLEDIIPSTTTDTDTDTNTNPKNKMLKSSRKKIDNLPEVTFIRVPKDSLNSRFLPIRNLKTDAVFMVDDDVRIDCGSIKVGFEAWRHSPNAIVGYYPRLASPKLGIFESKAEVIYHTWPIVFAKQKFNIILTKASFFHAKYLDMYHDDDENPKQILEYVDAHKNCEDIAMAFLVARKTASSKAASAPYCRDCPIYVHGKIKDEGLLKGISTSGGSLSPVGHMEKRSQCLDALTEIYEEQGWDYPLFDVSLGEQSWRHNFWWQNAPSNFFEWFSVGNTFM